jgi:hypothetical protein
MEGGQYRGLELAGEVFPVAAGERKLDQAGAWRINARRGHLRNRV